MTTQALSLSTYYVKTRTPSAIVLGLFAADQKRFDARLIEINNPAAKVEIGQSFVIAPGKTRSNTWGNGVVAKTIIADAIDIEPYTGRASPKIDGLDSATCKNLARRIGSDFAQMIARDPSILNGFRYSPEKRAIIETVCACEAEAASKVKRAEQSVVNALHWAGLGKARSRALAVAYLKMEAKHPDNPHRLLFEGRLSFKISDRFAFRLDPEAAKRGRPQAIIIDALRTLASDHGHTLVTGDEIGQQAWNDYGLAPAVTRSAIEALKIRNVVETIERAGGSASGFALFGVKPPSFIGLSWLVQSERDIIGCAKVADAIKRAAKSKTTKIVESAIAHSANLIGLALDEKQVEALRIIFANPLSIVTGPPGSGKTTIISLANIVAKQVYSAADPPIFGVALAGRAASMLQDAASTARCEFTAKTIHSALGLDPDADGLDAADASAEIDAPVLVIGEASMISSPLLAAVLNGSKAHHVVMLGDVDQLPPIGAGEPFADLISQALVPVTRLDRIYRTDLAGIQGMTRAIKDGALDDIQTFVDKGGVAYLEQAFGGRGVAAGAIWRDLVKHGVSPHEIAVITPRKIGDEGADALNSSIRQKLGFAAPLQVGDVILVTKNDYKAATPKQGATVAIFNCERCMIVARRSETFDAVFPGSRSRSERAVRFLHSDADPAKDAGYAYGYAMTVHKAQGSQFAHTILVTARPDRFVSRSSIYTAASRARERLTIIGDERELAGCAEREEKPRRTYLGLIEANADG